MPSPSAAPSAAPTDLPEARRELVSMFQSRRKARCKIPPEVLAEHILRCYGKAGWPVLRDAASAVLRRMTSVDSETLRVATRARPRSIGGTYGVRAGGKGARPYEILLTSLEPLRVSCDCPDYVKGSLGLCKHSLCVLADLAAKPRHWKQLLASPSTAASRPLAWWNPIRTIDRPGDWLDGVRLRSDPRAPIRGALRACVQPEAEGVFRFKNGSFRSGKGREKTITLLWDHVAKRRHIDPALRTLLADEKAELERASTLRISEAEARRALRDFKLKLYPYQRESLKHFFRQGRLLLADDMGLGKTVQATSIAHVLSKTGRMSRVLLIVPASLKSQWAAEWSRATDIPIELVDGSVEERTQIYARTSEGALVANYEQSLRDLDHMKSWGPELVILDEAQRIKNWATQTARAIKQLDVPYRLVLTGTPLENRLDELASIMDWIDPRVLAPKWRLGPVHQITADGAREVVGIRNLEVLRQRLAPRMLRRRRAEVLDDLPARTNTLVSVELTPAQRDEHDALSHPIAMLVAQARARPLAQAQFIRLMVLLTTQRIIANGLAQLQFAEMWPGLEPRRPDDAALTSACMPKLARLREIVESVAIEQGRKIVIFSQWRRALTLAHWATADLLDAAGQSARFFTGKESRKRRTQNVLDFHDDPDLHILFCTDAGGVGLNLQRAASCCINFELPWNPAVLEQRVGRIHRLGQSRPVDVYNLMSRDSIEARIAQAVSNKQALFSGLFDGHDQEVMFEGSASFLSTVEALVDAGPASGGNQNGADPQPAELDPDVDMILDAQGSEAIVTTHADIADPRIEQMVLAADETASAEDVGTVHGARGSHGAQARPSLAPFVAPSLAPTLAPDPSLLSPKTLRGLISEVRVEPTANGGMRIEASPEAAKTLGTLFAGLAELLATASPPAKGSPAKGSPARE
ncbi:MAG: DEAD/DEAH box helicase [Nannocystaceae bacterium]